MIYTWHYSLTSIIISISDGGGVLMLLYTSYAGGILIIKF